MSENPFKKRSELPEDFGATETDNDGTVWFNQKEGETRKCALLDEYGESLFYMRHFMTSKTGGYVVFPCLKEIGQDKCPGCEQKNKASKRYIAFVKPLDVREGEDEETPVLVWGYGVKVDKQLKMLTDPEEEGDPPVSIKGLTLRVKREGSGKTNTSYYVSPMRKVHNMEEEWEWIEENDWLLYEFAGSTDYDELVARLKGEDFDPAEAAKS